MSQEPVISQHHKNFADPIIFYSFYTTQFFTNSLTPSSIPHSLFVVKVMLKVIEEAEKKQRFFLVD